MADNVAVTQGSGTTMATDDVGGVQYPRIKVVFGADGSATDASSAAPLPVVQTGTPALPTGASTAAKQPALGVAGTASSDVITVQGVASMTPVLVDGSGVTHPTNQVVSTVTWQAEGDIDFGALTASFATAFTTAGSLVWVGLRNNTNGTVVVSLDAGTTSAFTMDPGDQISLDLKGQGKFIASSVAIQAKYIGSAPTSGKFRVNGYY